MTTTVVTLEGISDNFLDYLQSGLFFNELDKITQEIKQETETSLNEREIEAKILLSHLSLLQRFYEDGNAAALYYSHPELDSFASQQKILMFFKSKLKPKHYAKLSELILYFQHFVPIKDHICQKNHSEPSGFVFDNPLEASYKIDYLISQSLHAPDFKSYQHLYDYYSYITQAKKKIESSYPNRSATSSVSVESRFKESLQRFRELHSLPLSTMGVVYFDLEQFGGRELNKADQTFELSSILSHYRSEKNHTNPMEEIIDRSIQKSFAVETLNDKFQLYINFYSNLFHNILYPHTDILKNPEEKQQLLEDIKKIVIMLSYLTESIENNMKNVLLQEQPMKHILNYDKFSNEITQLLYSKQFSKESLITSLPFEKIKKELFNNNLTNYFSYYANPKFFDETFNEFYWKKQDYNIIETKGRSGEEQLKIRGIYNLDIIEKNVLSNINGMKLLENSLKFLLNYDLNIQNGKYNRPILIFSKNIEELDKIIKNLLHSKNIYESLIKELNMEIQSSDKNTY